MNDNNTSIKISRVRDYMKKNNLTHYIVFTADPHLSEYVSDTDKFREYLSGFTGSAGTLLITMDKVLLWVDGRYYVQAAIQTEGTDIINMHIGQKNVPNLIEYLKCENAPNINIGFDGNYISDAYFNRIVNSLHNKATVRNDCIINDDIWPGRPDRVFKPMRFINDDIIGISPIDKINNIRDILSKKYSVAGDYSYVISDLTSIMWILNLRGCDISHVPVAYSYLIISNDSAKIFVNKSSVSNECKIFLENNKVTVLDYSEFVREIESINNQLVILDKSNNNSYITGILRDRNRICEYNDSELIRKDIKNANEIESMRRYHLQDAVAMIRFIIWLKENMMNNVRINEYEAAQKMDQIRLNNSDCYDLSFDTISAYGQNAALPHYSAQANNSADIKPEGLYLVDCGGQYPLCTTDITRTISLGELTQEMKDCYTYVLKGNLRLMNAVFLEGTRGENLDILAREALWRAGYDYAHGTGHGIGCELSVHEGPLAIRYRFQNGHQQPVLTPGMVVSDEPGVYLEGEFGIRLENELLVVEKQSNDFGSFMGFESLTLVPFDLDAINIELLDQNELEQLNVYHRAVFNKLSPFLNENERKWLENNTKAI